MADTNILTPNTVVVVEDDPQLGELLQEALTSEESSIKLITRGDEVMNYLLKHPADFIFLDIMLPGLDGFELLKDIKNHPTTKEIPVVLLTNLSASEEVQRGLNLGAADYIVKSNVTLKEIKQLMNRHIVYFSARRNLHKD